MPLAPDILPEYSLECAPECAGEPQETTSSEEKEELVFKLGPFPSVQITLVEAYQNLVANAVHYMGDQDEPRVEVGWRQDGEEPIFFVRDNGEGIDESQQERIFDLFHRVSDKVDGTGIGLATVKKIVEVHRGRIWVESEGLGLGSTFCFTIAAKGDRKY